MSQKLYNIVGDHQEMLNLLYGNIRVCLKLFALCISLQSMKLYEIQIKFKLPLDLTNVAE